MPRIISGPVSVLSLDTERLRPHLAADCLTFFHWRRGPHPRRVLTLTPSRGFAVRGSVWPPALPKGFRSASTLFGPLPSKRYIGKNATYVPAPAPSVARRRPAGAHRRRPPRLRRDQRHRPAERHGVSGARPPRARRPGRVALGRPQGGAEGKAAAAALLRGHQRRRHDAGGRGGGVEGTRAGDAGAAARLPARSREGIAPCPSRSPRTADPAASRARSSTPRASSSRAGGATTGAASGTPNSGTRRAMPFASVRAPCRMPCSCFNSTGVSTW